MVFNTTFNIFELYCEETRVPGENHRPATSHWYTLSHSIVSSTPHMMGFELITLVAIDTDCIGSYSSNYHMITTTTALSLYGNVVL